MSREPLSLPEAAERARPVTLAGQQVLPVLAPLAALFPDGGLRRGSTVAVLPGAGGATSLALAVGAAASQAGSWCAAVGWPALGMVAAAGLGVALERFALVASPGEQWPAVTAALIDAVDLILLRVPREVRLSDARRLTARVRERGVVLVVSGGGASAGARSARSGRTGAAAWPGPDLSLSVAAGEPWRGVGQGYGYLQARAVEVTSTGRGAASRERRIGVWLPGSGGDVAAREKQADLQPGSISAPASSVAG